MAKKSGKETYITKGMLCTPVEGFGPGFPKSSGFKKEFGPHKQPGSGDASTMRPDGSNESQIVSKFKRGK